MNKIHVKVNKMNNIKITIFSNNFLEWSYNKILYRSGECVIELLALILRQIIDRESIVLSHSRANFTYNTYDAQLTIFIILMTHLISYLIFNKKILVFHSNYKIIYKNLYFSFIFNNNFYLKKRNYFIFIFIFW